MVRHNGPGSVNVGLTGRSPAGSGRRGLRTAADSRRVAAMAASDLDPWSVEDWVFDLDNTLYPSSCGLFRQVDERIGAYIQRVLDLDPQGARGVQRRYYREHGSSLRGLMDHHGIDPGEFLDFVHDIDLSPVDPAPGLDAALGDLPGRKIVYTNGSSAHAARILERLGIARHFAAVFDIVAAEFRPKPQPAAYSALVENHGIDPGRAVMIEDLARNLTPAAALGMTTVLVGPQPYDSDVERHLDAAHHVTDDLTAWLEGLIAARL